MRQRWFCSYCYARKKCGTCRKDLSICQLQSSTWLSRGFITRMEDMRFTGIQYSSHGSELLSPFSGYAQVAIGIPERLHGSTLARLHSAVFSSCRVQRMGQLNSIATIIKEHLS